LRIHVTIAEGSAPWDLAIEGFRQRLIAYRPDARTSAHSIPAFGESLSFDLDFGGTRKDGNYWPGSQLIMYDYPISDWSPVIVWFLGLLPEGSLAQCFLEAVPFPQPLPRTVVAQDVTRILTELDARY
jgi:hypothetical protein